MILYFKRLISLDVVEIEVLNTTEQVSCEGGGKNNINPYFITREKTQMN